ncbi:MAG: COX15/CtaA family protein [Alphaproteobacteria bacterium]|nr:COX15/CtaA family protein [Alphaproteobacteria bacterium]
MLAVTIALMQVGAITRLTNSGLSITEWRPLLGTFPPLSQAEWLRVFELYKTTSQYKLANYGFSLESFQTIFWWEYIHRLLGRLIGLVVVVPYLFFLVTRRLPRWLALAGAGLIALGGMQGVVGWWMVQSGFANRIEVSHLRLSIHLALAFAVVAALVVIIKQIPRGAVGEASVTGARTQRLRQNKPTMPLGLAWLTLLLVCLQVVIGAWVAGTNAGQIYTDFPLFGGLVLPSEYLATARHLVFDPGTIQANHRLLAYVLVGLGVVLAWRYHMGLSFLVACLIQGIIGVITLLLAVPVFWGAFHQFGAIALFIVALSLVLQGHHAHRAAG